jgi:AraC family transcriptional regulator
VEKETLFVCANKASPNLRDGIGTLAAIPYELEFSGHHRGLIRLKNWIAEHGALSLTLEHAAELACLSPHHFSNAFRKHAGETFKQWRQKARIHWAVSAMASGDRSISEVVSMAGYRDRRAFERAVKRLTGVTPARIGRNPPMLRTATALPQDEKS